VSFQWPLALAALALLPLAVLAFVWLERRRRAAAAVFASPALLPAIVPAAPGRRRFVPYALLLAALAAMLVGLARPHATLATPREEATVVLAVDVSFSMVAEDVFPTRLGAARGAAQAFLGKVPERFRVGVVAFGTDARVLAPATDDRAVVEDALGRLKEGEGTAIGEAIALSLRVARSVRPGDDPDAEAPPAAILLLSDGAQTQGQVTPAQAAQRARRAGIPVYTVALGTDEGIVERPIPGGFTERIRVPPDPPTMQRVAQLSGGEFFRALDAETLSSVYEDLGSRLGEKRERHEVTAAFAGAGAVLMLIAAGISSLWFRRPL
jgi:Ca-activated chloride channel homolog